MARISEQLLSRWEERVSLILSQDFDLAQNSLTREERVARARASYPYFVKTYFPHLATCDCGKFQIDAANFIKKNRNAKAIFEWARGHAKSTHISLLIPLWLKIQAMREINTMLLVSKSEESAQMLLSDLQAELETNELFKKDFGEQMQRGSWTAGRFITKDGCMFVAVGRDQTPRGIKNRGRRPDYIVIDDIDDDVLVRNENRVTETFNWCLSALIGAMDMGRGRFILVGNRIGDYTTLTRFTERPGFYHTIINAITPSGKPAWKEKYTIEEILKLKETMGEILFNKEYMNNPTVEGAIFKRKDIRFLKPLDLKEYRALVCYTDPSFKNSAHSDYKATVLVGKTKTGSFHVLKAYAAQCSISDMVQWHYEIHDWVNRRVPVRYYMESNFIQDLVLDEFKKEGEACGMQIPVIGDKRGKIDKFARIEAMQPIFQRGLVILNEEEKTTSGMSVLVEQLLAFQRGSRVHDDAPDALEGAIFLLTKRNIVGASSYRFKPRQSFKH